MEFIYAEPLKKEFTVKGKFFTLKYVGKDSHCCRSLLEIFKISDFEELNGTNEVDAIFIMMNPGSGEPENKNHPTITLNKKQIQNGYGKIELVDTKPDPNQYQVMRLMKFKEWKYVRVINLSDFRSPKSADFYEKIQDVAKYDKNYLHSIFSSHRCEVLAHVFKSNSKPVIVSAWGVEDKRPEFCDLINLAKDNNLIRSRVGYEKVISEDSDTYYYHPYQRREKLKEWLKELIRKIPEDHNPEQ